MEAPRAVAEAAALASDASHLLSDMSHLPVAVPLVAEAPKAAALKAAVSDGAKIEAAAAHPAARSAEDKSRAGAMAAVS